MTEQIEERLGMISQAAKQKILALATQAGKVGKGSHIGGSLSCIDALIYIALGDKFKIRPKGNDRLILSKGHAALALYVTLGFYETIPKETIDAYPSFPLLGHPVRAPELGIELSTGSLGMGISVAAGIAMSNKLKNNDSKTVVIIGDGELNEGSVYETLRFSGKECLKNLIVILDQNNFQQTGSTTEITGELNYSALLESLNFETISGDGHSFQFLDLAFDKLTQSVNDKPKCIIMKTLKGKGLPDQGTNKYHHVLVTDALRDSLSED